MKEMKRILSLLLVVAMLCTACCTMLASCGLFGGEQDTEAPSGETPTETPTDGTGDNGDGGGDTPTTDTKATYTATVKSNGGMPLKGVMVVFQYVGKDGSYKNAGYGTTDENGVTTASLPTKNEYTAIISSMPKGYTADKDRYEVTNKAVEIVLEAGVITDQKIPDKHKYKAGDIMYDFTVTTYDTKTALTLSEILAEKKMLLLNIWYDGCTWCLTEFPEMDEVYNAVNDDGVAYKDLVEIIAISDRDSDAGIDSFMQKYADRLPEGGLTFPVASAMALAQNFNPKAWPTTIVIDRYGMISLVVEGALNSYKFEKIFEFYTSDDYKQQVVVDESVIFPKQKPNVQQPSSEEINATISVGDIVATFSPETESSNAEYSWPFIISEKGGEVCIKASNSFIPESFATIYIDVEMKANDALAFDYWCSSEDQNDVLYVLVNRKLIYTIYGDGSGWETAYPYVALEDGTYELCFVYSKNQTENVGDDTVYIKGLRITTADRIDKETYIYRDVATNFKADGSGYETYEEVFFNEEDGYYHVGSVDGPILLAALMAYSQFSSQNTIWDFAYQGLIKDPGTNGKDYAEEIEQYANYSNNGKITGYCSVNQELRELLEKVADIMGVEVDEDREWLQMCAYYDAYGTNGKQMEDPVKGLATFSAYEAKENVENLVTYDRPIMPRGYLYKFVPSVSATYRITSYSTMDALISGTEFSVEGWIVDSDRNIIYTYEENEKGIIDHDNVSMVIYMEAGKEYYIDICYYDIYSVGTFTFRIENIGETADIFTLASPGYFEGSVDEDGNIDMGTAIAGGVDVMLVDGIYYVKNEDGSQGPILYADFGTTTGFISHSLFDAIKMGAFNFKKTNLESEIEGCLDNIRQLRLEEDGIPESEPLTVEDYEQYFIDLWGEQKYLERADKIADVNNGIFEGLGDCTEIAQKYADMVYTAESGVATELIDCVVVTEELATILQRFVDVYSFEGVDHAWTKFCFYYKHYGPTVNAE